jgi:hypothetical protein
MTYHNKNRPEKKEIPVMNKDEIAALFATKAQALNAVQFYRADGSPLVGALFPHSALNRNRKVYKGKKVDCNLLCCSGVRLPIEPLVFSQPPSYSNLSTHDEPDSDKWVKVEKRSVRRLKKRANFAKVDVDYFTRPNVFYAMSDD